MFLNFINFYRRFIHRYSKRIAFLIDFLKESKNNKKFDFSFNQIKQNRCFVNFAIFLC